MVSYRDYKRSPTQRLEKGKPIMWLKFEEGRDGTSQRPITLQAISNDEPSLWSEQRPLCVITLHNTPKGNPRVNPFQKVTGKAEA